MGKLFSGCFFIAALLVIYSTVRFSIIDARMLSIDGVLETSEVRSVAVNTGKSMAITSRLMLRYKYLVEGTDYQGTRYSLMRGNDFDSKTDAEEALNGLTAQAPAITVWFDPKQPQIAVVKRFDILYSLKWLSVLLLLGFLSIKYLDTLWGRIKGWERQRS